MLLTTSQAARHLHVTRHAIIMAIRRGRLIAVKFGHFWVIDSEELNRWDQIRRRK